MSDTKTSAPHPFGTCGTRLLKNIRYLQRVEPGVYPPDKPVEESLDFLPADVLAHLHRPDRLARFRQDPRMAARLDRIPTVRINDVVTSPLFDGAIYFVRVQFTVLSQGNAVFSVSARDMATAVAYATQAQIPIAAYASQYGPVRLTVQPSVLDYAATIVFPAYTDAQLQQWVDDIVGRNNLPTSSCIVVFNPPGIGNVFATSNGFTGYHQSTSTPIPYIFVQAQGAGFTVDDAANNYAQILSHEIAEMAVDPLSSSGNPEVCDPCGPNCQPVLLSFFDVIGRYIDTSRLFPPPFAYGFFINAIVQPAAATSCPAATRSCANPPTNLFMVWKGIEGDQEIWFSTFDNDSGGFAPQQLLPGIGTSFRTALASYNFFQSFTRFEQIHMAWKGIAGDQGIYFQKFDGAGQQRIDGIGTSVGPALAVFRDLLCMAWKGIEGDQGIYFSTFDGSNWTPQRVVPDVGTSVGPALATYGDRLYMAWKGIQGDQGIYWSRYDGIEWAPQQNIGGVGTSVEPALAVFRDRLYMAWKGIEGDQGIYFSRFDGADWAPQQNVAGVGTSVGPALAVFDGQLYMAWKGIEGDQGIYFSTSDGDSWATQQLVTDVGTSIGPALLTAYPFG
jgi:hypothetical protein